jgi:superfamily II DNA/RNA helicase
MQQDFAALGVSANVVEALAANGIHEPFNIQTLALPDALAGLDVLGKAPTGSGKTLAFSLPIVERTDRADRRPSSLVLVPTRELALQVAGTLELVAKPRGLQVATVYGGAPLGAQAKRAKGAQVVVATPGRLQDLVDRRLLSLSNVSILVLDDEGNEKIRWQCVKAWPSKMDPVDFNAKGNDRGVMTLTLVHEGVTQV